MIGHWLPIVLASGFAGSLIFVLLKLFLPQRLGGFKE